MNVVEVKFRGINPLLSSWKSEDKTYYTDRFNSVAIEVCGDNNSPVIVPIGMVCEVIIRNLENKSKMKEDK